jgi:hypothetical protein
VTEQGKQPETILTHLQAISEDLSSAKSSLSSIEASQGATIELLGSMAGNIARAQATLNRDSNGAL